MSAHRKSTRRAQRETLDVVKELLGLGQRLHEIAEGIPMRIGTDSMLEDRVPFDVAYELHGRLTTIRTHELAELVGLLQSAATASQEDLDLEFIRRRDQDAARQVSRSRTS